MKGRRSERPTPGRGVSRATPGRAARRTTPAPAKVQSLRSTWPLFAKPGGAFPVDPSTTLQALAPPSSELARLAESEPAGGERAARSRASHAPPGGAPDWMRAAHALSRWLEERLREGAPSERDQAVIARIWAAFTLGDVTEQQLVRVAHVVQRAHAAIRGTARGNSDLQAACHAAAGVLHAALPGTVRERMPVGRTVQIVRRLRDEPDAWAAIVEGTSELVGWKDYARFHAAAAIRTAIEQRKKP